MSPGLIFVQKTFLLGLFWGSLLLEGLITDGNFAFQNRLHLTIKKNKDNSLKQFTLTVHELIFGRACYRKDMQEKVEMIKK